MTTLTEVMDKVEDMKAMGASKTSANQMIRKLFEYKSFKKLIDEAITTVYGETTTSTVDWEQRVALIRDNIELPKKELLAILVQYEGGREASLRQMLGYIEMCKEWAEQEIADRIAYEASKEA